MGVCSCTFNVSFPVLFATEGGPGRWFVGLHTRRPSPVWWLQQWWSLNAARALHSLPWVLMLLSLLGVENVNICDGNIAFVDTVSNHNASLCFMQWKHYVRLVSKGYCAPKDKHELRVCFKCVRLIVFLCILLCFLLMAMERCWWAGQVCRPEYVASE